MSVIDGGGPAFPIPGSVCNYAEGGMTKRDYFAAKAMQGFAQVSAANDWPFNPDQMAEEAYGWADAMLKARNGGA